MVFQPLEYFVSIGVRPETLIILLVAGGISFLILLVALFMLMARIKLKRGQVAVDKPAPEKEKERRAARGLARCSAQKCVMLLMLRLSLKRKMSAAALRSSKRKENLHVQSPVRMWVTLLARMTASRLIRLSENLRD